MTDNCLVYAVMCESWMYFPKKVYVGFWSRFVCSYSVAQMLISYLMEFLIMLLLLQVI